MAVTTTTSYTESMNKITQIKDQSIALSSSPFPTHSLVVHHIILTILHTPYIYTDTQTHTQMFVLARLSDLIRIPPDQFNRKPKKAIIGELNKKYANKVVQNLGLVISVWDLIRVDDGLLKPGDGATFIKCEVRVVVFRPFVGEILTGWIEKCTPEGIKVNMEFFGDVFIPKSLLFEGSEYSINDNAWIWDADGTKLYLDINEKIRFRVEEEIFVNVKPKGPNNAETDEEQQEAQEDKQPSYAILGSCQTDGMGCISWWD